MKITIELSVDNEAFEPDAGTETAQILRKLAKHIDGTFPMVGSESLYDINGNTVGTVSVTL
jgi:hypothetical protein